VASGARLTRERGVASGARPVRSLGVGCAPMPSPLLVDEPAPHVRRLTLNRPDELNAMTAELCKALHGELVQTAADRRCRAVVLTGAGRGFCAGLDLHGYGAAPENKGDDEARDRLANQEHMSRLILQLRTLPQPVIAAVNGPAAGFGLALALGSDIRYAAPEAVFRAAFINIGVSNCDMGVSWLLPRLIGASRSHELMLTGRRVDAEEALRIGLLADVVDQPRLLERAVEAAVQIASLAPFGVRLTKRGMWAALEIPSELAAIEYEDRQQIMATFSNGVPEAIGAFLEKRPAEFED
jgi:enoyl-CoA hydratase